MPAGQNATDHFGVPRAQEELGEEKLEGYVNTILRLVMPNFDGRDLKAGLKAVISDSRYRSECN